MLKKIKDKLATLPLCPGVYIMKDGEDNIIYVGKSKVLKNRVSQYFQQSAAHSPKTLAMVSQIADFEYILTDTENEALALECNLIKKHLPKYNILLKDDKQYPYIKITLNDDFPRVFMTRQITKDGNLYLGPFMSAISLREAVEELRKIFKVRSCSKKISKENPDSRPCLYYQIAQCSAPCCSKITTDEYKKQVFQLVDVLNGNSKKIVKVLNEKMNNAAEMLDFEKAAQIRDKISAIKTFSEKQKVSSASNGNMDFIGLYKENDSYCIQVFYYRDGKAVRSEYFTFENEKSSSNELMEGFVKQFYFTKAFIPKTVYLSNELEEKETIEAWLSELCGHKMTFCVPKRGNKADIMKMVLKNAQESLYKERLFKNRNESYQNRILAQIKEFLSLKEVPKRIEAYDISNISGQSSIGVQVVYENAAPAKNLYRKYNIKTVNGADDYQSMREILSRRINEAYNEEDMIKKGELKPEKAKFLPLPDLILLDGGKGHVSAIKPLLETFGEEISLFGIVKDGFHRTRGIMDENHELLLERNSELFNFFACMQDEVHRYAIQAHRKKHESSNIRSSLEKIPGVGPAVRKKLLSHFKSVKAIKEASFDELKTVVSQKTAQNIVDYFKN